MPPAAVRGRGGRRRPLGCARLAALHLPAGLDDLVDEQQLRREHGAQVEHLALDDPVVPDALHVGQHRVARVDVEADELVIEADCLASSAQSTMYRFRIHPEGASDTELAAGRITIALEGAL